MSAQGKVKNAAENLKGKAKVAGGRATGNSRMKAQGRATLLKVRLKRTAGKARAAVKH